MDQQQGETCSTPIVSPMRDSWARVYAHAIKSSGHLVGSLFEANRAVVASVGGPTGTVRSDGRQETPVDELTYTASEWSFDRSTDVREELGVSDRVTFTKRLTDADVRQFAAISGDTNRLHLDDAFAEQTRFEDRIVHGTLLSGLISAALARLPGLTIYLSQEMEFLAPARIGDTLTVVCEIVEDLGDGKYRLTTCVYDDTDELLIDGEAVVLIDTRPEERPEEATKTR